jgi:hypothetical protein
VHTLLGKAFHRLCMPLKQSSLQGMSSKSATHSYWLLHLHVEDLKMTMGFLSFACRNRNSIISTWKKLWARLASTFIVPLPLLNPTQN